MKTLLFDNDEITFEVLDGILVSAWKSKFIDITLIRKVKKYHLEIMDGKSYPMLADIKSVRDTTKEARDFLASKEGCAGLIAIAIMINSPISKMIANFFILASRPVIPTKMFTDETEAKKWLLNFTSPQNKNDKKHFSAEQMLF